MVYCEKGELMSFIPTNPSLWTNSGLTVFPQLRVLS